MLQKLSIKTGLSKTEIRVIGFLLITLAAGFSYITFIEPQDKSGYKKFDYSEQDSLFLNAGSEEDSDEASGTFAAAEKSSSAEILELDKKNFSSIPPKKIPAENSINLNTADLNLIITLPGIGKKTAQRLLDYRKRIGRFSSYSQLLEVKGIGNSRLEKIKKYAYIK